MNGLIEIALKAGPWLLAVLGLAFGWARHKQAQTTQAQARQAVAEANAKVSQNDAIQAKANADAARIGADAVKERTNVENDIASGEPGDAARLLRDKWSRD